MTPELEQMNALPQFLAWILSGWVNRAQQDVINYLQEESRALREQLGGKRLHPNQGALHNLGLEIGRDAIRPLTFSL